MNNKLFLCGVGSIALAGALAATPAYANGTDGAIAGPVDDDRVSVLPVEEDRGDLQNPNETRLANPRTPFVMAPLDSFDILQSESFVASLDRSVNVAVLRNEAGYIARPTVRPEPRLIVRDDVGVNFGDPDNTVPSAVHIFLQRNSDGGVFFNCTGSVINPRTILTAAHCVNGSSGPVATTSSETYGLPGSGAATTMLIATGQNSGDRLFTYLGTGAGYSEGGVASSTDVIIHPTANADNVGLGFPWADVALIAVDSPITDVPALPILLTPLTQLTHVVQVGYGTNGTGLTGGTNGGSRFLRRVGENMLGLIGSPADYIDGVFPDFAPSTQSLGFESQPFYWTDFDNPDRTPQEQAGCVFTGSNIQCDSLAAILAIDYFDGDALPLESGTAPGDSGSPLIVDELYDFPLVIGVLSGGFDFFGLGSAYSDVSFYNPLYPFFEFISENTAYKYVSARRGNGNWSDPTHWVQDLDPGFFIDDGSGNLVNGIPSGNEPGILVTGPRVGTVLGNDISGNSTDPTPGFEGVDTSIPESSVLLGPGSTGFVPNNTDGTPGTAFANPAQYFEVHLNRRGTTTVDMDVEIDRLVVDHRRAGLVVPDAFSFTTLIDIEQHSGTIEVDGTLSTPFFYLIGGELEGDGGVIDTNVLLNINGLLSAGGTNRFGSLTIDGDYLQSSGGALWSDFTIGRRRAVTSDSYDITGMAVLDGDLIVATRSRRVRFGSEFSVLTAGEIDGNFADVTLISRSPVLDAISRVEGNQVIVEITARSLRDILGGSSSMRSLGTALDTIRASRFSSFSELFAIVDNASFDTLGGTLASLTPISAFEQSFVANAFSQRFTGQIAQRTLSIRGGSRAAGAFSAAGNAGFALAESAPANSSRLGMFGSASGVFLSNAQNSGILGNGFGAFGQGSVDSAPIGANALEQAALSQAGELTIGADLRVGEGFSFGVAVSSIQSSEHSTNALAPVADRSTSVAIYATYSDGGMFADGYAGTSDQRFGVERASLGDFTDYYSQAIGQADGNQVFGGMRLGYAFDLGSGFEIGPVASFDYVRNSIGGYDEIGAGAYGLSVADRTFTSMGAKAGAMASFDIAVSEKSTVRAFGSVAYARELADKADVVTAHFFGASDVPFTIANELDPSWVSVNAGAEIELGANFRAAISVTSDMGRGALSNDQGQASLIWRF